MPYPADTHFTIQNLPYGVYRRRGQAGDAHVGVAIGDQVLDLHVLAEAGLFADAAHLQGGACFKSGALNEFMGLGKVAWDEARALLTQWLSADCAVIRDNAALRAEALVAQSAVQMELPARIEQLESELQQVDEGLGDPSLYDGGNSARFDELNRRRKELPDELAQLYSRWEELEAIAEEARRP